MRTSYIRPLALLAALVLSGSCRNPQADAAVFEQLRSLGDELNADRQQVAQLQAQVDSLIGVAARQDTLLRRLAGMAGMPVGP